MHSYAQLLSLVEKEVATLPFFGKPDELYDPIRYFLALGGKRLRPVLTLMGTEMFDGEINRAMPAAMAIEVFHNFTLVHDDIMDKAALRRGKPTVHHQWNETIAILSGDLMMIKAGDLLLDAGSENKAVLLKVFNATAIAVCEGQQLDMNFESRTQVTLDEYIHMISLKTAVLLGCSLQLGAMIAGASQENWNHLYAFGKEIGIAFQIQDDILDTFGEGKKTGKQVGGDINANKKTLLLIHAWNKANDQTLGEIESIMALEPSSSKIERMIRVYNQLSVKEFAESLMQKHLDNAFAHLNAITVPEAKKSILRETALNLMTRNN